MISLSQKIELFYMQKDVILRIRKLHDLAPSIRSLPKIDGHGPYTLRVTPNLSSDRDPISTWPLPLL